MGGRGRGAGPCASGSAPAQASTELHRTGSTSLLRCLGLLWYSAQWPGEGATSGLVGSVEIWSGRSLRRCRGAARRGGGPIDGAPNNTSVFFFKPHVALGILRCCGRIFQMLQNYIHVAANIFCVSSLKFPFCNFMFRIFIAP